jgi:hypothetical protein
MSDQIVMLKVPKALELLIKGNNELLKQYKEQLYKEVKDANEQMMQILKLDPAVGWRLDLDKMMYVRLNLEESSEELTEEPSELEQEETEQQTT